jgi:serine/threonine protein kinase
MEFMDGGSLTCALYGPSGVAGSADSKSGHVLPAFAQRLEWACQIAEGMSFLHAGAFGDRPIVHHDLKPDNVLLTAKLDAKIADFGLSRTRRVAGTSGTSGLSGAGTPLYMAPECWDVCAASHLVSQLFFNSFSAFWLLDAVFE